jgi:hypothetical protein
MDKFKLVFEKKIGNNKKSLLWISESPYNNNRNARITYELCNYLQFFFDLTVFAINHKNTYKNMENINYSIINSFDEESGILGTNKLPELIENKKPNIIIILNEPLILSQYSSIIYKHNERLNMKIFGFVLMNYDIILKDIEKLTYDKIYCNMIDIIRILSNTIDKAYVISDYDSNELLKYDFSKFIDIIPFGINKTNFKKIDNHNAKLILGFSQDTFIFYSGSSNKPRKNLDIIINAYIEFLIKHHGKKVLLLMNCNPYDTDNNLIDLFQKLYNKNFKDNDWQKYIKFIKSPGSLQEISDSDLSLIYSASDVGLSASIAENICLPNIEHAFFGKPQIVPKSSSFLYVFKNDSGTIRLKPYLTDSFKESLIYPYGKVWYTELAKQMLVFYENNHFLKSESQKSEDFFSKYSWENSSIKLIKSIYDL